MYLDERSHVVYAHKNKVNQKQYIGITKNKPEHRWGAEGHGYVKCPYFWNAIQKWGWENFEHEIIAKGLTVKEAIDMEIELIAKLKTTNPKFGYNTSRGGDVPDYIFSKTMWEMDGFREDMRQRMQDAWKDPEKRKRRSEATKRRWENPEFRAKTLASVRTACCLKVICVETGDIFDSIRDAAIQYNVHHANITRSIKVGYRCGGYHWEYYDDVS